MTGAPGHALPNRVANGTAARDQGGHGRQMIRVQGMPHPEQHAERQGGADAHYSLLKLQGWQQELPGDQHKGSGQVWNTEGRHGGDHGFCLFERGASCCRPDSQRMGNPLGFEEVWQVPGAAVNRRFRDAKRRNPRRRQGDTLIEAGGAFDLRIGVNRGNLKPLSTSGGNGAETSSFPASVPPYVSNTCPEGCHKQPRLLMSTDGAS